MPKHCGICNRTDKQEKSYIEPKVLDGVVDTSGSGLPAYPDEDGTSYYYREAVNNNWVLFGDIYYRIIRRNGNGSVRTIYNGKSPAQIGVGTQLTGNGFNKANNNPTYVGYMYKEGEENVGLCS